MSDLSKRIQNLHVRSKNVGREYLTLFCECVETMGENWTPMAELLSGANDKDKVVLRRLAGFVLSDWTLKADKAHRTGLRFVKGADASFDADKVSSIREFANQGKVLQGKEIREFVGKKTDVKVVSAEDLAKAYLTNVHKKIDDGAISAVDALEALRMAIKALEVEVTATVKAAA